MPFDLASPAVIALAGDWHGNIPWSQRMVRIAHDAGAQVIVQLGDFGFWRDDPSTRKYLRRLERTLAELNLQLLWVDGNHEDHARLRFLPLDVDGTRPITDHITHLPRGHRWTWHDSDGTPRTWLALGGAISVDRDLRTLGRSWWPEEAISDDDLATAINGGPADVMLTHDAPAGAAVPTDRSHDWPAHVLSDAAVHRERLRSVVDAVHPSQLWHGHFHVHYDTELDLGLSAESSRICHIHGLDSDNTHWATNLALVNAAGHALPWPKLTPVHARKDPS